MNKTKTILIIDDSPDMLDLTRFILEAVDFKVFSAESGREALAVLSEIAQPDLILLDMDLHDMTGADFLLILEEKMPEIIKSVPVIFVTGFDQLPSTKASGCIKKPFSTDKFLAAVQNFIKIGV